MANNFLTPSVIAREALMILENNLIASRLVHRDHEQEFTGARVGDTVTIRRPASFSVDEFAGSINVQDINEGGVPLTLEKHYDISVGITAKQLTLELDAFSEQVVAPAMTNMAEKVDSYIYSLGNQVETAVGTAGTTPAVLKDLSYVDSKLLEQKVPLAGRSGLVDPTFKAEMLGIDAVARADARGDEGTALREASMGRIMGIDWYGVQGVQSQTAGTAAGVSLAINNGGGYSAGDDTINLDGGSASETLLVGDIIEISGEGQHTVTEDNTASTGAFTGVKISPALREDVADDTGVTVTGDHTINIAGNMRGISLAVVPLQLPMESGRGATMSYNGLSIRVVMGYDQTSKTDTISFDLLVGGKVTQPELLTRFIGKQ